MKKLKFNIFVINMRHSKERWESIRAQLDELGLPYERIEGCDASILSKDEIEKYYSLEKNKKTYPKPLSVGEIGCHISHIMCWEKLIKQDLDFAIILEDDIVLGKDFSEAIAFLESIFDKWQLVRIQVEVKDRILYNKEEFAKFSLYEFLRTSGCAWGYALKIDSARCLIDKLLPFGITADSNMHLYHNFGVDTKTLIPPVVFSRSENDSEIETLEPRKKLRSFYPFARQTFSLRLYASKLLYLLKRDGVKLFFERLIKAKKIKSPYNSKNRSF